MARGDDGDSVNTIRALSANCLREFRETSYSCAWPYASTSLLSLLIGLPPHRFFSFAAMACSTNGVGQVNVVPAGALKPAAGTMTARRSNANQAGLAPLTKISACLLQA
jgi:hypothetical protein